MFNWLMNPIRDVISWVLLRWHDVWALLIPGDGRLLGTNWDWVLAIVFLVATVRIVLFPIFVKQIRSQRAMQALAPKVKELQTKHKGDPQTLREEMMKLYQTEKVNPLMGCLPMLLQIPVFFGLFGVLRNISPTGHPQWGWTAAQFESAKSAQLFTAPIPAAFSSTADHVAFLGGAHAGAAKIVAGLLVLIMMFTTFVTQRQMIMKTGWQQDPQQRMIQRLMLYGVPFSLLVSGWAFPIGVVIYWVTQNLVSLAQQQWVLRKYPPMVTAQPEAPKSARQRAATPAKRQPGPVARFFLVLPPPAKSVTGTASPVQEVGKGGLVNRIRGVLGRGQGGAEQQLPPQPTARSLAPRPGAKPRTTPPAPGPMGPASAAKSVSDEAKVDESTAVGDTSGTAGPTPPSRPAKPPASTRAKKASPTQRSTPAASSSEAKRVSPTTPATLNGTTRAGHGSAAADAKANANGSGVQQPSTGATSAGGSGTGSANGSTGSANGSTGSANGSTGSANGSTGSGSGVAAGSGSAQARSTTRKSVPTRKGGQSGRKGSGRR
jgi:YidC/Oxa1 family membrane protein insertase